jgi:hypothetical protein
MVGAVVAILGQQRLGMAALAHASRTRIVATGIASARLQLLSM